MEVVIQKDSDSASKMVAKMVARAVKIKPDLVLGLATGRTMEPVYTELVRIHKEEKLDFSACRTFNLDEYAGLSGENKHSYRHFMNRHLFDHINIDKKNTHLPNGTAKDLVKECADYEALIASCCGIDLQLLGIGSDGHIGFNEPLSAFRSRTRVQPLNKATIEQNSPLFDRPEEMPRHGITMGVSTILDSKSCILLATGDAKAEILAKAVEGPLTSMITASALQFHEHCTIVVDEAASVKLQGKEHYRWVFENEPEWAEFR